MHQLLHGMFASISKQNTCCLLWVRPLLLQWFLFGLWPNRDCLALHFALGWTTFRPHRSTQFAVWVVGGGQKAPHFVRSCCRTDNIHPLPGVGGNGGFTSSQMDYGVKFSHHKSANTGSWADHLKTCCRAASFWGKRMLKQAKHEEICFSGSYSDDFQDVVTFELLYVLRGSNSNFLSILFTDSHRLLNKHLLLVL